MAELTVKYNGSTREPLFDESSWEFTLGGESQGSFTWTATSATDVLTDKTVQVLEGAAVVFEGRIVKVTREVRGLDGANFFCVAEVRGLEWYLDNHTPLINRGFPSRNNREIIQAVISDAGDPGGITALDADVDVITGDGEDILAAYKDATVRQVLDDLSLRTGAWWRVDHADKGLHFFATPSVNDAAFDVDDGGAGGTDDVRNLSVGNTSHKPLERVIVHGAVNDETGLMVEGSSGTAVSYTSMFSFPWVTDALQAAAYAKSLISLRGDRRIFSYQTTDDDLVVGQLQNITDSGYGITAEDALISRISTGFERPGVQLYSVDAGDPRPTVEQYARQLEAANDRNQDLLDVVTGIEFDGTNDHIVGYSTAFADLLATSPYVFSISGWVLFNSFAAESCLAQTDYLDPSGGPAADTDGWAITVTTAGKIRFRAANASTETDITTTNAAFTAGEIHHFVIVFRQSTALLSTQTEVYIDGGSDMSVTGTKGSGTVDADNGYLDIGAASSGGDPMDGWIYKVVLTNAAISSSEAAGMYAAGITGDNTTGLFNELIYLVCDDLADGVDVVTVDDTSGNGDDFTANLGPVHKDRGLPKNI